ncbi:MAG: thioredoxin-disulfide reductase [Candidatus Kerfeldbacteria bacterium]|nr:thioredoxin-disulfide reductase [Candidatus Kerfeldbacteria bacterium]
MHHQVIIIGSGPAGLTAGIYLGRASLKPLLIAGEQPGGQLTTTSDVGNYPGFTEDIAGPVLMDRMMQQAKRFGTEIVMDNVTSVDFTKKPFTINTANTSYTADTVIVATGASAKWIGLESEQRLRGKGVSACATCDAFFFKNKDVAIVGGGDTAMEEATFLTKFAKSVTVIVRGPKEKMAASRIMIERAQSNPKITMRFSTVVEEVLGDTVVTGVRVKNIESGDVETVPVQGLFVAIGHKPNTEFLGGALELTKGYIKVTDNTKTSVEGVFAGGDAQDWKYRQAVTAAGLGCMAALDAEKYLAALHAS